MDLIHQGMEFSEKKLFEEIKEAALREGVFSIAQYKDLIDELIEEKRIYGFFSDDEDLTQIKEDLQQHWPEVEKLAVKRAGKLVF